MGNLVVGALPPFFAVMQKDNMITDAHYGIHIMGNYHRGGFKILCDLVDQLIYQDSCLRVEAGVRFIYK